MAPRYLNYYSVLGLPISASRDDIQTAYDRRMEEVHRQCHIPIQTSDWDDSPPMSTLHSTTASDALQTLMTIARTPRLPRTPPTRVSSPQDSPTHDSSARHQDAEDTVIGIIQINKIEDAFQILAHPVKKKAYDMTFCLPLQTWEMRRILRDVPRYPSRGPAEAQARKWRRSLEVGHDPKNDYDEGEFNRVDWLGSYSVRDSSLLTASMACGEVIASFIDGMDL